MPSTTEAIHFVSGLTSEVTVFLRVQTGRSSVEMQPGTGWKFRVVADLRKAKEGTVEVPLIVEESSGWFDRNRRASKSFCKNPEESEKSFAVRATIPDNQIVDGITASDITLETTR